MYVYYNPNPKRSNAEDCTVRALTLVMNKPWGDVYDELCDLGHEVGNMPGSNHVWNEYLLRKGYKRYIIPNTCPSCYTVRDFAKEHPHGTYVLGTGSHVVTVMGGDYYDAWDSGYEVPIYYFKEVY